MSTSLQGIRRLFCYTSLLYSCLDPDDAWHGRALELAAEAVDSEAILSSTWDVISETMTLLCYRKSFHTALRFLDEVKPTLDIVLYAETIHALAEETFRLRGGKRRLSFCDAVSFIVVTTLLDNIPCLSFDEDFQALGLTVIR